MMYKNIFDLKKELGLGTWSYPSDKNLSLPRVDLKFLVWERDDWTCQYCGRDLWMPFALWKRAGTFPFYWFNEKGRTSVSQEFRPTVDHLVPKSKGGKWEMDNLVTACFPCNLARGNGDIPPFMKAGSVLDLRH